MPLLRDHRRKPTVARDPQSLFISGGIGDVIALSCFLDVPDDIKVVYYATQKRPDIEAYLTAITSGRPLTHRSVWDDWCDGRWAFYSLSQFLRESGRRDLAGAVDWSIHTIFPNSLPFRGLPWSLGHPLSSIHEIELPDRYAVFQPFSTDKRDPSRDFTAREIEATRRVARDHGLPLVLLNAGDDPPIDGVIDLQNRTNLYGSIDITLGADLYIGIDSAMSQVATKILPAERLLIKSVNPHYYRHLHWYCAPHIKTPFVVRDAVPRLNQLHWSPRSPERGSSVSP